MSKDLAKLLNASQKEIIDRTAQRLHKSSSKHYQSMAVLDLYPQIEKLFNSFLLSIKRNRMEGFVSSAAEMGLNGFKEGCELGEMQLTLNSLAESFWETVRDNLDYALIPEALESINRRIIQAKDKLSLVYLDQCLKTEVKLLHLKREFEDFLKTREVK